MDVWVISSLFGGCASVVYSLCICWAFFLMGYLGDSDRGRIGIYNGDYVIYWPRLGLESNLKPSYCLLGRFLWT